jgi:hypothetical protein
MSVQQKDRIDSMGLDAATDVFWLNMTEDRPWTEIESPLDELKAKINTYIGAVQTGGVTREAPESKDKPIGIRLDCAWAPSHEALQSLSVIKGACEYFRIRFAAFHQEGDEVHEIEIEPDRTTGAEPTPALQKPWWKVW